MACLLDVEPIITPWAAAGDVEALAEVGAVGTVGAAGTVGVLGEAFVCKFVGGGKSPTGGSGVTFPVSTAGDSTTGGCDGCCVATAGVGDFRSGWLST